MAVNAQRHVEQIELELLLEALYRAYGLDLRSQAGDGMHRRLTAFAVEEGVDGLSGLQARVLRDPSCVERLSHRASVGVSTLFRDPDFHLHLRRDVLPDLRTWPSALVWVAGCATGEEAYALSMMLHEEGLGSRVRIHATDRSRTLLAVARTASYPAAAVQAREEDYRESGGRGSLLDHFVPRGDREPRRDDGPGSGEVVVAEHVRRNVTFSVHDLVADGPFNEFQVVLCRNVITYMKELQKHRVLGLIDRSLVPFGVLGLGDSESLGRAPISRAYRPLSERLHTWRKLP